MLGPQMDLNSLNLTAVPLHLLAVKVSWLRRSLSCAFSKCLGLNSHLD